MVLSALEVGWSTGADEQVCKCRYRDNSPNEASLTVIGLIIAKS